MLQIVRRMSQLNIAQLLEIYAQSITEDAKGKFSKLSEPMREAEQSTVSYLQDFFLCKDTFLALWEVDSKLVSALRMEPYKDGYLLTGLETAPAARGCGYATELLQAVLQYARDNRFAKIYSHVSKDNIPSLAVHNKCDFQRIAEHAVYLDGSVLTSSCTLCIRLNTK